MDATCLVLEYMMASSVNVQRLVSDGPGPLYSRSGLPHPARPSSGGWKRWRGEGGQDVEEKTVARRIGRRRKRWRGEGSCGSVVDEGEGEGWRTRGIDEGGGTAAAAVPETETDNLLTVKLEWTIGTVAGLTSTRNAVNVNNNKNNDQTTDV